MAIANLNGRIYDEAKLGLPWKNRSFLYGDGLFETIRVFNGKIPFLNYHYNRLWKGMETLQFSNLEIMDLPFFESQIRSILSDQDNARIRFTVFRKGNGRYTPTSMEWEYLIESSPLHSGKFQWNEKGTTICLYRDLALAKNILSPFKTMNSLPYVLSGIFARSRDCNAAILLNPDGYLADGTYANIWLVQGNKLKTPSLDSGCIDGITRQVLIEELANSEWNIEEGLYLPSEFEKCESIFLTNSIRGLEWVRQYRDQTFSNKIPRQIFEQLNRRISPL